MAEIPRVPQAVPAPTVNQQVHRVGHPGDRRQAPHRDREKPKEDVLELHDEELEDISLPLEVSEPPESGGLDIAI